MIEESSMDSIDNLFILACKSIQPRGNVLDVYKEHYLKTDTPYIHIVVILTQIVEKYNLITVSNLINNMSPTQEWMYVDEEVKDNENEAWFAKTANILISAIRFSARDKFNGDFTEDLTSLSEVTSDDSTD